MTRRKWTTAAQEEWLKGRSNEFALAEANNDQKTFFSKVITEWLEIWQYPEPTAEDIANAGSTEEAIQKKRVWQDKVKCVSLT
jgi:hypothetical protein